MEVIQDELQKNGVPVDLETLSEHIEYILGNYRDSYNEAVNTLNNFPLNIDMFQKVFKEINVDSTGRAVAYLTLVYRTNHLTNQETVRQAVRLVVPVLRNASGKFFPKVEECRKSGRWFYTEPLFVGGKYKQC